MGPSENTGNVDFRSQYIDYENVDYVEYDMQSINALEARELLKEICGQQPKGQEDCGKAETISIISRLGEQDKMGDKDDDMQRSIWEIHIICNGVITSCDKIIFGHSHKIGLIELEYKLYM